MMFLVRSAGAAPPAGAVAIKAVRNTPAIVPDGAGKTDYFCVGDAEAMAALRDQGCDVVELRDGWYADDQGGGVAIFGHGRYWEIRDTLFTIKERAPPEGAAADTATGEGDQVNVRGAIFGV
jgi:hypothetical protein